MFIPNNVRAATEQPVDIRRSRRQKRMPNASRSSVFSSLPRGIFSLYGVTGIFKNPGSENPSLRRPMFQAYFFIDRLAHPRTHDRNVRTRYIRVAIRRDGKGRASCIYLASLFARVSGNARVRPREKDSPRLIAIYVTLLKRVPPSSLSLSLSLLSRFNATQIIAGLKS
jgi:hypothetical protein